MRIDKLGRNRKKLIEKSTPVIFRLDNETIFKLCDKLNIHYDSDGEVLDNAVKKRINEEIKQIIRNFVK